MRAILSLLLSLVAACAVAAEGASEANSNIDAIAKEWLASTGVPSASIAIVKNGEMTYAHAYGNARLEPRMLATTATRYAIDSVSKEFTAAAVLFLVEQESYTAFFTPFVLKNGKSTDYGLGLDIETVQGAMRIGHDGEGSGYLAANRGVIPRANWTSSW